MPTVTYEGREFEVDNKGYLTDVSIWDREVALIFARSQGIDRLDETHWSVITFIRDHFLEHDKAPLIREICSNCSVTLKQLYQLFPKGPVLGACRIAGISKPEGCV